MKWEFTDVEFKVLCNRHWSDSMLPPFTYVSRTPSLAEYQRELAAAGAQLDERLGSSFDAMIDTIARPELLYVLQGWCDSDFENPEKWIRARALRSGMRACVITMKPGETDMHSGGFTVVECTPEQIPAMMVALLPDAGPGRLSEIQLVTETATDDSDPDSQSFAFDSFDDSVETRSMAFLSTPAELTGTFLVGQGRSKFGPRGRMERILLLRDIAGDGRYLTDLDAPVRTAVGVTTQKFVDRIGRCVGDVLAHMENQDDRAEEWQDGDARSWAF
ncbi:ESX secretion-associated protein EspG [Nocardia sp. NPDC057668]|uniref:ESX secretion-associated protein EspG n=1 Tax=Nocardia sp. NPDC057668 TaxID=3346202 RepID=UPI00366A5B87